MNDWYCDCSNDNFARLFPRQCQSPVLNKIFELVIDDLHYISYPLAVAKSNSSSSSSSSSSNDSSSSSGGGSFGGGGGDMIDISVFNVVISYVREEAMDKLRHTYGHRGGDADVGGRGKATGSNQVSQFKRVFANVCSMCINRVCVCVCDGMCLYVCVPFV